MNPSAPSKIFTRLLLWAKSFSADHDAKAIEGSDYDLPGQTAYTRSIYKIPTGGRVEVNLTSVVAQASFSWLAEITLDDAANELFRHILLQTDHAIVETIGKTVIPIDDTEAEELFERLLKLVG